MILEHYRLTPHTFEVHFKLKWKASSNEWPYELWKVTNRANKHAKRYGYLIECMNANAEGEFLWKGIFVLTFEKTPKLVKT